MYSSFVYVVLWVREDVRTLLLYNFVLNLQLYLVSQLLSSLAPNLMTGKLKIVLLGASGQTGQPLLSLCLERGHQVVAVVRSKATTLTVEHSNLRREEADIFSSESLTPIFRGQDVVISTLGFPKQVEEKMTKFTESMAAVLEAMRGARVRRIITMSAWYTDPGTRVGQVMFDTMWSKVPGLVNTLNNEGEMDLMLAKTEETISFTSVLVPTLSWDPVTDREIISRPGRTWVEGAAGLMPREGMYGPLLGEYFWGVWG